MARRLSVMVLVAVVGCGGSGPLKHGPDGAPGVDGATAKTDAQSGASEAAPEVVGAEDAGTGSIDAPSGGPGDASDAARCDACGAGDASSDVRGSDARAAAATPADAASHVDGAGCVSGFAHCTTNPLSRCETDLSTPSDCGGCGLVCPDERPVCVQTSNVRFTCLSDCALGRDHCGKACVDLQTDPQNCGGCGIVCGGDNVVPSCVAGKCSTATCQFGFGTCPAVSGVACATPLDTPQNCGACGTPACSVAHSLLTCAAATTCDHPVCAAGFANCDTAAPDCETAIDTAGACFPRHLGTSAIGGMASVQGMALAPDGSIFLAGSFSAPTDFDPGPAHDDRMPKGMNDAFVTKLTSTGTYAWTLTFGSAASNTSATAVAVSGTSIVIMGGYSAGDVDFDPGPGIALRPITSQPSGGSTWVTSLTSDGKLSWVSTFTGTDSCGGAAVAVDASGAVYVTGQMTSTCDFDPGPGIDALTSQGAVGYVVKLEGATGKEAWARVASGATCTTWMAAAVVAADGNLWVSGQGSGACSFGMLSLGTNKDTTTGIVASFTPTGVVSMAGSLGTSANNLAAASDGSIYVGGLAQGIVDLDPGPAVLTRALPGNDGNAAGFVVKLGPAGGLAWAKTLTRVPVVNLAATADSGVVAVGQTFVDALMTGYLATKLGGDGAAGWSMGVTSPNAGLSAVAANATTLVFGGWVEAEATDIVPGAVSVVVPASSVFVSRYAF